MKSLLTQGVYTVVFCWGVETSRDYIVNTVFYGFYEERISNETGTVKMQKFVQNYYDACSGRTWNNYLYLVLAPQTAPL